MKSQQAYQIKLKQSRASSSPSCAYFRNVAQCFDLFAFIPTLPRPTTVGLVVATSSKSKKYICRYRNTKNSSNLNPIYSGVLLKLFYDE